MATATDIRLAVKGLVEAAVVVPSGSVYDTRTTPYASGDLPAAAVYGTSTVAESRSLTGQSYTAKHRIAVQVTCEAASDAALGAALDSYEAAVLSAVLCPTDWMENLESVAWTGSEKGRDADADRRRGSVVVSFDIEAPEAFAPSGSVAFDTIYTTANPDPTNTNRPLMGWTGEP